MSKSTLIDAIKEAYAKMQDEVKAISDELRNNAIEAEKSRAPIIDSLLSARKDIIGKVKSNDLSKEEKRKAEKQAYIEMMSLMFDRNCEYDDIAEATKPRIKAIKEKHTAIFEEILSQHSAEVRKWATEGELAKTICKEWNIKELGKAHLNAAERISLFHSQNFRVPEIRIYFNRSGAHIENEAKDFMPKTMLLKRKSIDLLYDTKRTASPGEIIANLSTLKHTTGEEFIKDIPGQKKALGISDSAWISRGKFSFI